jgi:hypothetical protein
MLRGMILPTDGTRHMLEIMRIHFLLPKLYNCMLSGCVNLGGKRVLSLVRNSHHIPANSMRYGIPVMDNRPRCQSHSILVFWGSQCTDLLSSGRSHGQIIIRRILWLGKVKLGPVETLKDVRLPSTRVSTLMLQKKITTIVFSRTGQY